MRVGRARPQRDCEAFAAGVTGAHARAIPTEIADTAIDKMRVTAVISWARATARRRPRRWRGSKNPMYFDLAEDMAPTLLRISLR